MDRALFLDRLREFVQDAPAIRVAWLGGADATNRVDAWSDVDLMVVTSASDRDAVFDDFEGMLAAEFALEHRLRLPEPLWHGHGQALYGCRELGPDVVLDLTVLDDDTPVRGRLLEPERHGTAVSLVDLLGWLDTLPRLDSNDHRRVVGDRVDLIAARTPFMSSLVEKAMARSRWTEAIATYHERLWGPLCELMRIEHDPSRFDFGARYVDRDLPEADRSILERLAFVPDASGLQERVEVCRAEIETRVARFRLRSSG